MKKLFTILSIALLQATSTDAQHNFNGFSQYYPIGEGPNINLRTSYVKSETILFEANPTVRYSFYNDMQKKLGENRNHAHAYYIAARPQLRMYTDSSLPVKMPAYRVLLSTQQLWRVKDHNLFSFSIESGHYSNGQSGCAFNELYTDGSRECDSVYSLITDDTDLSAILNRRNGNFSTNMTELLFNYRINRLDDDDMPDRVHSITFGATLFHDRFLGIFDFGGYSDADIKIYGRFRFHAGYEYERVLNNGMRLSVSENMELISKPHKSVNPFRSVTTVTWFPKKLVKEFGVYMSYVFGHDNYNFRFVDSGHQGVIGITWSGFPPFALTNGAPPEDRTHVPGLPEDDEE